jgi:hypothetical protein
MMNVLAAVGIYVAAAAAAGAAAYLYLGHYWHEYRIDRQRDRGDS